MNPVKTFRQMLKKKEIIIAPGVYDCVSAKVAEKVGLRAIYMGGFGVSGSLVGKPDLGLISGTEMIDHAKRITSAVGIPVFADADTGYGNALNMWRTVKEYEKADVAAIHIEDQIFPKKCGNMPGRHVISTEEMVSKVKAAVDARVNEDFAIIVRSDSYLDNDVNELIDRGHAYLEAGADGLWPLLYQCKNLEEMKKVGSSYHPDVPLMFTLTHYGAVAYMTAKEAFEMGYRLIVSTISPLSVVTYSLMGIMKEIKEMGSIKNHADRIISFDDFTDLIGLPEAKALEAKYGNC